MTPLPLTWNERLDIKLRNRGTEDVERLLALIDAPTSLRRLETRHERILGITKRVFWLGLVYIRGSISENK